MADNDDFDLVQDMNSAELNEYLVPSDTPAVVSEDRPLTDIRIEYGALPDGWDGRRRALTLNTGYMEAVARAERKQKLADVALAKLGDAKAAERAQADDLSWTLTPEAAHDKENTEDVLGMALCREYGTGDFNEVWDAMNASADYEYEQMPAWNTRAEGSRLVWGRFTKMMKGKKAAAESAQAVVNERLKGLEDFTGGKDAKRDDAGKLADDAMTEGRMWELANQGVLDVKDVQRAMKVREFMQRYVVPLGKRAEMDERMRGIDGLRDELFELIGDDKDTARLAYDALTRWAGEQRAKNDTGAGDEFQVAVGKKLSDWSRVAYEVAPLALVTSGAPGPVSPEFAERMAQEYAKRSDRQEKERLASGMLRAAIDEAMKVPEGGFWQSVRNAPRVAAMMAGDTLPYLVPFVGGYLGASDAFVRAYSSGIDMKVLDYELGDNKGGWENRKAMGTAALAEGGIQALVEIVPWSRVGNKSITASIGRKMKAATAGKYVPGALSRAVARVTQKSLARAMVTEFASNVAVEGLVEPIAQGVLTMTAEGVMDRFGVEHGRSKSFSEAFAELGEIWSPEQLAGFLMFSAALTAPAYWEAKSNVKLYKANVKKFARNVEVWESQGLSRAEAEEAAGAEDPVERGRELVDDGWQKDPEGMHARLLQKHKELKESGRTIVFAGVNTGGFDADTVKLMGEAWRASQKRFHLPEVELLGDGRVRLTREEIPSVIDAVDLTLTAEQADAFLFQEIARMDAELLKDWQKSGGNADEYQSVQVKLADLVDRAMGDVAVDAAVAEGSMDVEAMGKGLPEDLRALIQEAGGMNLGVAKKISEWAMGQMAVLEEGGMSRAEAREQVASEEGGATLGELSGMGAGFEKRLKSVGDMSLRTSLHRRRGGRRVQFNGRSVLGSVLVHARGGATGMNAVEDVSEAVFDMLVQSRTEAILENQAAARKAAGEAERPATLTEARDAEAQAWAELADVARKAREALLKVDPDMVIEEVDGSELHTIEALSTMALGRYINSAVLPRWMSGLVDVMRKNVQAAAAVVQMQKAMVALGEQDAVALKDLLEFLDDAGVQAGKSLAGARVEAVADRIRELARWHAGADAAGPGGVGGMSVSQAQEEVLEEEDEIQQNDKAREAVAKSKPADAAVRENEEDLRALEDNTARGSVPERMRGVFVGDSAVYDAAGDFWCGKIEKGKLQDGTEQVKVGEKGKHGVIVGRELTGRFVNDTAPILVWKRRDGSLQVISGRHRFAKLMEDESATGAMCYVYEESDERDEKWARMKDYEQNMIDDQADEVTCAVYARETGLTEAEMHDRGLTRNGSRSKRGIFIGKHAREELWTRFRNGEIKPMDAELVCKLTAALADQGNVEEIQAHCCGLLKAGKSWDYIGASVQLMASAEAQKAEQMLLDLGADFTADLERMARWVELCRKAFREAIDLLKDEKRRVKKGAKASRLGLSATMTDEKREEMLGDLEAMDAKFEMIGSYPELVAEAKLWDGDESKFADPVAMYLERVEALQSESLQEEQDRKAAEEATPMFSWSLTPSRARSVWNGRVAGKDVQRVVDFNGAPVDLAVSSRAGEKGGDALRRVVAGDYRDELERWKQEALSVLQGMVSKKKWNDVEQHVRAGKATMDVVKRAIADGKIAPLPKQGVKVSDEDLRALHSKRIVYFEKRKGEVLDLLEGVMGVRSVDESKLSSSVYFNTPYGKVRLSDHAEPMGTGHAVSTVLDLRYDMSDADVLAAAEGMKNAQGGTFSWSVPGSRIPLAENQVKVKNKIIVTFKDGVKRSRKAHVTRSNGSEIWAVMPEIEELKKIGFPGGNVYLEVGDNKNGLLHLLSGHAAEILSLYPGVSLMAGLEMFVDEAFSSIAKLRGSYVGKGKKKDLNIDSTAYDSGERRKKKRVSLSFHKTPDKHYTISTVFEPDANKPFPRIKEEKDGLTCTVTVELDGKAPGLPTSFIHKPSDAWPRHARRPSENKYITPNSNVKGEDIEVDILRDIKHPDVEAGARTRGNGNFSASVIGRKARTWDKYVDRAFAGRDDGMWRAEIDASGAKLKWEDLRGKNVAAYRQIIADWDTLPKDERQIVESFAELCWERDEASKLLNEAGEGEFPEVYRKARKLADEVDGKRSEVREVIGRFFQQKGADGSVAISVKDEIIDAMSTDFWSEWGSDKVEDVLKSDPLAFGMELRDVLDFPELYEAYPQLGDVRVYTEDLKGYKGMASNNGWSDYIMMNRSLLDNWEQFHSTLLHEAQHLIQRIEGFAKGGNKEHVRRQVKELLEGTEARMEFLERDLRWFSAVDIARDFLKEARRLRRYPNEWKRSGQRFRFARMSSSAEEIREEILRDIAARYEEFRREDTGETLLLEMEDSLLPVVQFSSLESIEAGLAALEKIKSRKLAFRGTAAKKNRRLADLQKRYNGIKRVLAEFEYEPYELYVRLAGEIEARNVQARLNWTAEQRAARPFNETLEYPGEALVTYSVIGRNAKTWSKYVDRAFAGRDDGMWRAEIDASQAKLKNYSYSPDYVGLIPRFRALVAHIRSVFKKHGRWQVAVGDWSKKAPSVDSYSEVNFVRKSLENFGIKYNKLYEFIDSGILKAILEPTDENIGQFLKEIRKIDSISGVNKLSDVLDYPELYAAYPELRDVPVIWQSGISYRGLTGKGVTGDVWIHVREGESAERIRSTLLHEVQHVIQFIEGFAIGGSSDFPNARKWMSDNGYLEEALGLTNSELYDRLSGEIESRNVQKRQDWTDEERAATPFNETLEYPGEAIAFNSSDLGYSAVNFVEISPFTYSLTGAAAAGRRVLEESGDEYVANRLQEAWQKNLEKWSVLNAGKADANSAMRAVMEMEGLVKATYDVVQDDVKLGRLYMLQRWAMVYARMVESGEIPPKGALKGPAYEKFVERLTAEQRTEMRRGMSREQAEDLVKELGVTRLESAMEKVARECLRAAEWHLKQKETARVKRLLEAAWPKREEGKKSPRGKLAAREYRRLEWIAKVMELSAEDKYKETKRIIREINELPQELVGYEERKAELEAMIAALDPAAADYVERKVELEKEVRELNPNEVGYEEAKAELEDQLNWLHVFGGWAELDVSQARKAARTLEDLLLRGFTAWELKVQRERERTRRVANEISSHFKTPWYETTAERKKDSDKAGTNKAKMLKGLRWGLMGYAQMMLALRKKLGNVFCDRQRRTIAEAHRNLLTAQKDLQDWSAMELQKITGLTGAALEQWIAGNNQNVNTGIMLKKTRTEKITLDSKMVDKLELMSAGQREEWRLQELAKADADGRAIVLPTDAEVHEMAAVRRTRPGRKKIVIERTEYSEVELVATKEGMLYAVLLFEQPDYEHLVVEHGMTWADVDAMKKIIGPKLLRWGYAMRKYLNENGELLAAKYEDWNGTPFGRRANYFRGVFDVNKPKPETDIIDDNAGANPLGGSKYSILIPRRYHRQQINWQMGASHVFMLTMNEQNNYIHTQHITREWRQLLSRKWFADGLSAEIGTNAVNMIKLHLDVIDAAPRADAAMTSMFGRLVQGVMKATAVSSLALNVYSYIKQVSCLLNAVVGGYVPDAVVKQSGVYQVLTYSGIGAGELVKSYARVLAGKGALSFREMTGSAVIQSRIQSGGKRVAETLMLRTGQKLPNKVGRAGEVAGEWALEQMDMIDRKANTVAAMVVADAVYRKLSATEGGKEAGDKWVRAQAVEAAGLMVDLVAQPKLRTQKGLWASHGGFFGGVGNFFYMFRSESLAKIGTYLAQISSGDYAKALGGFMSMGVGLWLVGLLCSFLKGQIDGDDLDDEKDLLQFARKSVTEIVFGDLASLPIIGGGIGAAKAAIGGTWHYVQDPLQMLLPVSDLWKRPNQLYKAVDNEGIWSFKAMRALCNCLRVGGNVSGWGLGTGSAASSSACGIILGAAVIGNAGRFALDVAERLSED